MEANCEKAKGVKKMKAKSGYSEIDDRKYIGKVLAVAGLFAAGSSLAVAWPAFSHIGFRLVG